jgi:hypothetical protein
MCAACAGTTAQDGTDPDSSTGNPPVAGGGGTGEAADAACPEADVASPDVGPASQPDAPGSPEADAPVDRPACGIAHIPTKVGCSTEALSLERDVVAVTIDDYLCSAQSEAGIVRITACLTPPYDHCYADSDVTYCAVVEADAALLASSVLPRDVSLDGTATFAYPSPNVQQVEPRRVTYVPASPDPLIRRVWVEQHCFCTPTRPTAAQTVKGAIHLGQATGGRVVGHVTLEASGAVSPVNYVDQTVKVSAGFDVAIATVTRPADAGPDVDAPDSACTDSLEAVRQGVWGECPTAFDGNLEAFGCWHWLSSWLTRRTGFVDGFRVMEMNWGAHAKYCIYGSADGGMPLVGAVAYDDSAPYCGNASLVRAGTIPGLCTGDAATGLCPSLAALGACGAAADAGGG